MFYKQFIKYGLNDKNNLNLDEVANEIISNLNLNKEREISYIYNSVKRLSDNFYDIISFFPFKIKKD
nr:MAG TPA: hypothetical protein [Caudoviricetes sp.]